MYKNCDWTPNIITHYNNLSKTYLLYTNFEIDHWLLKCIGTCALFPLVLSFKSHIPTRKLVILRTSDAGLAE